MPEPIGIALSVVQIIWEIAGRMTQPDVPDAATIREIFSQLSSVESDVRRLEDEVASLTHEVRRGQAIDLVRDIDAQRAQVSAGLVFSADHPGDTAGELTALSAATALSQPAFYTFAGRAVGSPDRYDPRAALPSFLEAVSAWTLLRKYNKTAWTTDSQNALRAFAAVLQGAKNRICGSVVCVEKYVSYDRAVPDRRPHRDPRGWDDPPPVTEPKCKHQVYLFDAMSEETIWLANESRDGYCAAEVERTDPARAKAYLDRHFLPDKLSAIAEQWLVMAS